MQLNLIANKIVKPFLSQVEGVSEIRNIGGKEKEYWIEMNETKMSLLGITPQQIADAMSNARD